MNLKGVYMKKINYLLILSALSSFSVFSKIETPSKNKEGYNNINQRKEYEYSPYPNEKIWHEFGRPYWRVEKAMVDSNPVKEIKKVTEVKDSDNDSVSNAADHCPNTPAGHSVNSLGCSTEVKERITLDVKFSLNKAKIQSDYTTDIDKLASTLKRNKNLKIEIQGHTDTTGTTAYNRILSQSRSNAVKQYLINQHGISSSRLEAKGYGQTEPMADNSTFSGRKKNRRVEIKVLN